MDHPTVSSTSMGDTHIVVPIKRKTVGEELQWRRKMKQMREAFEYQHQTPYQHQYNSDHYGNASSLPWGYQHNPMTTSAMPPPPPPPMYDYYSQPAVQ
ncbi:unnamed protein product, partial [Orchesella dallaii]